MESTALGKLIPKVNIGNIKQSYGLNMPPQYHTRWSISVISNNHSFVKAPEGCNIGKRQNKYTMLRPSGALIMGWLFGFTDIMPLWGVQNYKVQNIIF
jgi:hypothetical protein